MTEYCDATDVQNRLTAAGYKFLADQNGDGSVGTTDVASTITPAIVYAGNLVDACVLRAGCETDVARGAANAWLKDRAIDIAAYRVSTTGGAGILETLRDDYDMAIKMLNSTTKIPGLSFNYATPSVRTSRAPTPLNLRR